MARETAESKAFQHFFYDLVVACASNVVDITSQLYSKELVSYSTLCDTNTLGLTDHQKATNLFRALKTAISREPEKFQRCVGVLRENAELHTVADELERFRDKIELDMSSERVSLTRGGSCAEFQYSFQATEGCFVTAAEAGAPGCLKAEGRRRPPGVVPPHTLPVPTTDQVPSYRRGAIPSKATEHPAPNPSSSSPSSTCSTRPVLCTEGGFPSAADERHRQQNDKIDLDGGGAKTKSELEIQKLQQHFVAFQIDAERKLSDKDLILKELTLRCTELREQRDKLETDMFYYCHQLQNREEECSSLEVQVAAYEKELKKAQSAYQMEVERLKHKLKETKELLVHQLRTCYGTKKNDQEKKWAGLKRGHSF